MDYKYFVKKAIQQDSRNQFEKSDSLIAIIPAELQSFYQDFNPVDVEVTIKDDITHFYPIDELESLQEDYNLGSGAFVFATTNSDPIFYKEGKVFMLCHDCFDAKPEKIADSFEEYLGTIEK